MSLEKEKSRRLTQFQLFNISHRNDLFKLFEGAKIFNLNDEAADEENDNTKSFEDNYLSDVDNNIVDLPVDSEVPIDSYGAKHSISLNCTTCEITTNDSAEHRLHYRLDWHRYNLKRKVHGQKPVTEAQFDDMMDDLSSIEGSDVDESETADLPISRLMEKIAFENEESELKVNKTSKSEKKLINSPNLFFENAVGDIFSVFKLLMEPSRVIKEGENSHERIKSSDFFNFVNNPPCWAIIMASGGHFAAAVFEGNTAVLHKTFHSYTVRAKQGGSQGARDAKGGSQPKSAGASLRRYNEASFSQHIQDLLESWNVKLKKCDLIFYRAVSSNSNVLFGGKSPPLEKSNIKLRTIPFPTKRPTFSEVKRVQSILSSVQIYGNRDKFIAEYIAPKILNDSNVTTEETKRSKGKKNKFDRAKSRSPTKREEPLQPPSSPEVGSDVEYELIQTDDEIDFNDLKEYDDSLTPEQREEGRNRQQQRRRSKPKKPKVEEFPKPIGIVGDIVESFIKRDVSQITENIDRLKAEYRIRKDDDTFTNELIQVVNFESSTVLHIAAKYNFLDAVWCLLECGCDPSMKDKVGKYPYNWAETKECRAVFRRFMGQYPDKYDYQKAQVPGPLTEELEQEKAEKKRALNKLKREKEKQKKLEKKEKEKETEEKDRFLNLSDREKRALAAERRILGQCKRIGEKRPVLIRCFDCGIDITGKVPFEYNQNVFCSSKCLTVHRKKFPTPLTL